MSQTASTGPAPRERLLADGYVHAAVVQPGTLLAFVSGQVPTRSDGSLPEGFEAQCRQVWANIGEVLAAAGMTVRDVVKVTTFLASRDDRDANRRSRRKTPNCCGPERETVASLTRDRTAGSRPRIERMFDEVVLVEQ